MPHVENLEQLRSHRREIYRLAALRGAENIRIVGSFARDAARPDSDIDLLVDVVPGHGLLDLGSLLMDLEELLGRPIELLTEAGILPEARERVLSGMVAL